MHTNEELVTSWLDYLRVEEGVSPHTISGYRRDIARFVNDISTRGVSNITHVSEGDIRLHIADLRSGTITGRSLAPSSIARAISSIRGFYNFLFKEGICRTDPTHGIITSVQRNSLPKALSVDEAARLLDTAHSGDTPVALRDSALLEFLYATGARISEAVALALDDIALNEEMPIVKLKGKGNKERLVPLGSCAQDALKAYIVRARPSLAKRGRGNSFLFLNLRGAPLSRQSAWEIIVKVAKQAGLSGVSPHTLRHSFATHLLEGGASVRDVQELLGHASVQTTQIYTRMTVLTLREVYRSSHPRAIDSARRS